MTMAWLPTVKVAKRAMMNASPRFPAVTTPSELILAELSLLLRNRARRVTSRSVPSEYLARAVMRCVAPSPSSTSCFGRISSETGLATVAESCGAPASSQRISGWHSSLSDLNSAPPVWGTWPIDFWIMRLSTGSARLIRRVAISRVRRW